MSENSPIEWTDHTFNPWWGCAKVSPGCDHCYAERDAKRFYPGAVIWGTRAEGALRRVFDGERKHWTAPISWNRKAGERGVRERVFCASMADVFDNHPGVEDDRQELWTLIHKTPNLDWQLLTKRVGNVARMVRPSWMNGHWPANAWIGASIVNQEEADRDIPKLLALPAPVRFLSCEPLLGPIDFYATSASMGTDPRGHPWANGPILQGIHWIIAGGESGPRARPAHPDWFRGLRDQCEAAGVPFLFKQWGEWAPGSSFSDVIKRHAIDHAGRVVGAWQGREAYPKEASSADRWSIVHRAGKKAAGRQLDGVTHDAFPS